MCVARTCLQNKLRMRSFVAFPLKKGAGINRAGGGGSRGKKEKVGGGGCAELQADGG